MTSVHSDIVNNLAPRLKGDVAVDEASRTLYATAACMYKIFPAAVVYPKNTADVIQVVRFAKENGLSVTPRGAASSLVGQAVNSGIMLDFTKYMNRILGYNEQGQTVRVQPGTVYGALNRYLKQFARYFPPDPSSGEYCTIGGMVANNATGAHSIKNGATVDYIESLEVVLADGELVRTKKYDPGDADFLASLQEDNPLSEMNRFLFTLAREKHKLIKAHSPKVEKNTSGYRLEKLLQGGQFCPGSIFCSSEGTLGIITEIELKVKKPEKYKLLTVINFDTLEKAAQAIDPILDTGAGAVEMMEKKALTLIRKYMPELHIYFPEDIESQLYVEFSADDLQILQQQNHNLCIYLERTFKEGMSYKVADSADLQQKLWKVRKASFPLVYNEKRPEKVLAFIEDFVVKPKDIALYIRKLYEIYEKYDTEAIILGHAGRGNFHARPFINLKEETEVGKVQHIMDDVFELVRQLGGSLSGEHGDGRARAHLLPRQAGPLYEVYEQVKHFFDSENRLNPGVKINRENQLTKNLRFSPAYKRIETKTVLHFEDDDYYYEAEKCHGCSACRQTNVTSTMCPLFQITGDELAAPRGKANILQNLISGDLPQSFTEAEAYKKMLDYCVYCEGCYVDCSSHVDVGRLLLEHKARYRKKHWPGIMQWTLEHSEALSRVNSFFAPIANPLLKNKTVRVLMEKTIGIDRRRVMPEAERPRMYRKNIKTTHPQQPVAKVVFFPDLYARYNHSRLTRLAIQILEKYNVQVIIPELQSAAMPAIVYGNVELARKTIRKNLPLLSEYVRQGYAIVSSEPTAVLALRKEWKDILNDAQVELVAGRTFEFFEFLRGLKRDRKINGQLAFKEVNDSFAYHAPCHLKALQTGRPALEFLREIPGLQITEVNRGCCGIAGTYGFKKGSNGFEQSMKIGAALFRELSDEKYSYGLTECSTCKMQMEQGADKQTLHPIEVLAQALEIS